MRSSIVLALILVSACSVFWAGAWAQQLADSPIRGSQQSLGFALVWTVGGVGVVSFIVLLAQVVHLLVRGVIV